MEKKSEKSNKKEYNNKENNNKENNNKENIIKNENKIETNNTKHNESNDNFYLRYNAGHKGEYGYEFIEFEFTEEGRVRYANNSNYKSENLIRKEVYVNDIILDEVKKIIVNSKIFEQEDKKWPRPNNILGSQELEIIYKNQHIFFSTCKIGTFADIKNSKDPVGLEILYYLVSDLKCFLLTLMNMHFKIKPVFKNN